MGHWATHAARRRPEPAADAASVGVDGPRTKDLQADAPVPQSAICRCGATVLLVAGRLPRDWSIEGGEARCGDCVRGTTIEMDLPSIQDILRRRPARSVGASASRYRGCRIGDEIVCGLAAIEMRAGASPPPGRDEAISFLLDSNELDQLIIELSGIRAELIASQISGTAARERSSPCAQ